MEQQSSATQLQRPSRSLPPTPTAPPNVPNGDATAPSQHELANIGINGDSAADTTIDAPTYASTLQFVGKNPWHAIQRLMAKNAAGELNDTLDYVAIAASHCESVDPKKKALKVGAQIGAYVAHTAIRTPIPGRYDFDSKATQAKYERTENFFSILLLSLRTSGATDNLLAFSAYSKPKYPDQICLTLKDETKKGQSRLIGEVNGQDTVTIKKASYATLRSVLERDQHIKLNKGADVFQTKYSVTEQSALSNPYYRDGDVTTVWQNVKCTNAAPCEGTFCMTTITFGTRYGYSLGTAAAHINHAAFHAVRYGIKEGGRTAEGLRDYFIHALNNFDPGIRTSDIQCSAVVLYMQDNEVNVFVASTSDFYCYLDTFTSNVPLLEGRFYTSSVERESQWIVSTHKYTELSLPPTDQDRQTYTTAFTISNRVVASLKM